MRYTKKQTKHATKHPRVSVCTKVQHTPVGGGIITSYILKLIKYLLKLNGITIHHLYSFINHAHTHVSRGGYGVIKVFLITFLTTSFAPMPELKLWILVS